MRVTVPPAWMIRCRDYGEAFVAHRKAHNAVEYRKIINDINAKPDVISHSKAGEVAFALMQGFDPTTAIEWNIGFGGGHWDVLLNGKRVDVKTLSKLYSECVLMWGVLKWPGDFEEKQFDVLALVAGEVDHFIWKGWVTKDQFRERHSIALGHRMMVNGTPFMNDYELESPQDIWPDIPER